MGLGKPCAGKPPARFDEGEGSVPGDRRAALSTLPKNLHELSQRLIAVAMNMKTNTPASIPWLARELGMGSPFRLSRLVSACRTAPGPFQTTSTLLQSGKFDPASSPRGYGGNLKSALGSTRFTTHTVFLFGVLVGASLADPCGRRRATTLQKPKNRPASHERGVQTCGRAGIAAPWRT